MTIRDDDEDGALTIEQWRRLQAQPPPRPQPVDNHMVRANGGPRTDGARTNGGPRTDGARENGDLRGDNARVHGELRAEATRLVTEVPPRAQTLAADHGRRACETCDTAIDLHADPRRRYCSASCRAKAAKRRRGNSGEVAATGDLAATVKPVPPFDLGQLPDLACALLKRPEVREIEIRVADIGLVIRR